MRMTRRTPAMSKAGFGPGGAALSRPNFGGWLSGTRRLLLYAVPALAVVACGDAEPSAADRHNPDDQTFVGGMIAHQRQALAMADLAEENAQSEDISKWPSVSGTLRNWRR